MTQLKLDGPYYNIHDKNAITFDGTRYILNFDKDTKFGGLAYGKSLQEAQNLYGEYLAKGDLVKLMEAKLELEETTQQYAETKAVFQTAVDRMNEQYQSCLE